MALVEVTMPKMGESITEGTVIVWHKKPGDAVELDEPLLEIGTDKVDTEVPSPSAGILAEILVEEGATVEVGTVIARIEAVATAGNGRTTPPAPTPAAKTSTPPAPAPAATTSAPPAPAPAATGSAPAARAPATRDRVEVVMPKMGESITEGTILTWHKKPGDPIELDETLLEIGTDKVDTEVPSPAAGTVLELLFEAGTTVDVGTPIAVIAVEASTARASASTPPAAEEESAPSEPARLATPEGAPSEPSPPAMAETPPSGPARRSGPDGAFYSPLVRAIASKEGVSAFELSGIPGTGAGRRVTKKDLERYLERRAAAMAASPPPAAAMGVSPPPAAAPGAPSGAASVAGPAAASPVARPVAGSTTGGAMQAVTEPGGRVEIVEMDRVRQIISEHMIRSKATSAHVTSFAEIDVTNLVRLREAKKDEFQRREGVKLTYTPFFVFAAVEALKDHPLLNASVDGTRIIVRKDFHVGIAVAIGTDKLMVPVIRFAGQKNVAGLAHAAHDLAVRARSKQLTPDDLAGGTFTVTNVGSLGSIMGTPIINQPQVAILATGAIRKRPMVIEDPVHGDLIGIRHMMYASLSYDHRIIDGAMAASFLQRTIQVLESFGPEYEL